MNVLRLTSSNSDVVIEFTGFVDDGFLVVVASHDHSATRRVDGYTDGAGITRLFADAAKEWKGWHGEKVWESLEGELRIALRSDHLGHVVVAVRVRSDRGGLDPWQLDAEVGLDAGQLRGVARDAERMWCGAVQAGQQAAVGGETVGRQRDARTADVTPGVRWSEPMDRRMSRRTVAGIALCCLLPASLVMIPVEQGLLARGVLDTRDLAPWVGNERGTFLDHVLNVWHWDAAIFALFLLSLPCSVWGIWLIATRKRRGVWGAAEVRGQPAACLVPEEDRR